MATKKTKPSSSKNKTNGTLSDQKPSVCDEELMTTKELMDFLNLSRTKVWEFVNKEGLPAFKLGGDYRYRKSEVLQWLEKYRVQK